MARAALTPAAIPRQYPHAGSHHRLWRRAAIDIDPGHAEAWALLANAQGVLHYLHTVPGEDEDELQLANRPSPWIRTLAEAHAAVAQRLVAAGRGRGGP